jgi:tetratricopeptide (TPR) repeat protein
MEKNLLAERIFKIMTKEEENYKKGVELLRDGQLKEALKLFNQLVERYPSNADYWSERGVVYFHMNEQQKALADLDQAVILQSKKSYRYASRAYVKAHFKMTREAIADYQKAIELDPEDAIAINNLGLLEEQLGYNESAKKHFQQADELVKEVDGRSERGKYGKNTTPPTNLQKEINQERENASLWKELKSITTREGFASFKRFLRSGMKDT